MRRIVKKRDATIGIHTRRYQLAELNRRITPKNRQAAIDTGAARGKEAW